MRSLFLFLAVLLAVSPVFGETMLIIETSDNLLLPGPGKFKVDIYGQNIYDFYAVQTVLQFHGSEDVLSDDFQISETNGNPDFSGQAIWPNDVEFPYLFPVYDDNDRNILYRQVAGFVVLGVSSDFVDKILLQTVWYDYTANASGHYAISFYFDKTVISDSLGSSIRHEPVLSSITIIPEPSTYVLLGIGIGIVCLFLYFRKNIFPSFSPVSVKTKED